MGKENARGQVRVLGTTANGYRVNAQPKTPCECWLLPSFLTPSNISDKQARRTAVDNRSHCPEHAHRFDSSPLRSGGSLLADH